MMVPPGVLVAAAYLHAHVAVLDDVDTPDAVFATDGVQTFHDRRGREHLPVDGDDIARAGT